MERLHRVAHQVVWVNPLKASPNFAPLARGMAAALPYVDEFVEGHSLASLEHLARVVSGESISPKGAETGMKEVLDDIERWRAAGHRVAVARVVGARGVRRPRPGRDHGRERRRRGRGLGVGRLRRGRGRRGVARGARPARGERGVITFGYSDDEAFAVGLTCGGTIHLYVEPLDW